VLLALLGVLFLVLALLISREATGAKNSETPLDLQRVS